jgi:isochorismate synthase
MTKIFNKVQYHFDSKLPFVIYKKPNELNIIGVFQNTTDLFLIDNFTEKGFIFCSFDGNKNIIIPENQSEILMEEMNFEESVSTSNNLKIENEIAKDKFEKLVQNGINFINENQFQKVVLSRMETIELSDFNLITTFKNNINNYPTAFCYCFFHPEIGLWFGATPEQLLQVSNNKFSTVSLAGTQKVDIANEPIWYEKEKQEQQFVTDFIKENLDKSDLKLEISEPFTARAGNLIHLKTIISSEINSNFNLKNCIEILHPTPAVCGLPKQEAKDFIIENEGYNREFYTGFLGELNYNNKTDLFVNLRCMKLEIASFLAMTEAHIFVGCGITKDSIPEKEWQETVNKSFTMKTILNNIKLC